MNKLLLTGILTVGTATQILNAQTAGQENRQKDEQRRKHGVFTVEYWQIMPITTISAGSPTKV